MDYEFEVNKLQYLDIGQEGETGATRILIDMKEWVDELNEYGYEDPCCHVLFKPYNQNVPVEVGSWNSETGILTWLVTTAATAVAGLGYTEIRAFNHQTDGLLKKSKVIPTTVHPSVSGVEGGIPPAPYDDWLNQILILEDNLNNALSNVTREYIIVQPENYSVIPADSAGWSETMPDLAANKGKYLWTRTVITWSTGSSTKMYNISYIASDAQGVIASINGYADNVVVLDGADIKMARGVTGSPTLKAAIEALQTSMGNKLDAAKIVYTSDDTPPSSPTQGTIWLKPKAVS